MGDMGLPIFNVDQGVIKKYEEKMMEKGLKYVVHEILEGGRFIAKEEVHHQELVITFMSVKNSIGVGTSQFWEKTKEILNISRQCQKIRELTRNRGKVAPKTKENLCREK
jgi:hypothetical protein